MVAETHDRPTPARPPAFTVLITDDDQGSRETLAGVLADQGIRTVQASCGEEAIEIVRVELIHLAFFDMQMPRMTGLEALQQVRLLNDLLPAILVTADATREVIRRAFQAQVFSVIPKPVNKHVVIHTMTRALVQVYGPPPDGAAPPEAPESKTA